MIEQFREELRETTETPKECLDGLPTGTQEDILAVRAIKEIKRLRNGVRPEPPKKAVYEWRGNELSRDGGIVGDIRLLTHIPFRVGWKAFSPEIHVSVSGQTKSIPLAIAAVEAVVRAHYGDEV